MVSQWGIHVRILDKNTLEPIDGANVTFNFDDGSTDYATTGGSGKCVAGAYTFSASAWVTVSIDGYRTSDGVTVYASPVGNPQYTEIYLEPKQTYTAYVNVTRTDREYTGSPQVVAQCTSSSGNYYLAFGTSTTTAPTTGWSHTSLSKTNPGTYYIWKKCNASSPYPALSARYDGPVTISKATISPTITYSGSPSCGSNLTLTLSGNTGSGSVTWSSSNFSVLSVSSTSGNSNTAYCTGPGTATVTASVAATTNHKSGTATKSITVPSRTGSTGVSTSDMTITYGTTTGTRTVSGNTGTVTVTSSATGVATVSISGSTITVTRKGYGSATIIVNVAASGCYTANSSTFTVNCNKASISPSVTCSNPTYGSGTVTASVSGNSGSGAVTWSSSNTAVATVNSSTGVVTPVKGGTARITASIAESTNYLAGSAYKDITVNKASQPLTISPTSKTIYDRSGYNTFTITPSNAQGSVTYQSSNTSVATVNTSGVVTYVGAGTCTITVTAAGNDYYNSGNKTCSVTCAVDTVKSLSTSTSTSSISYGGTATISVTATYESGYSTDVTTSASYSTSPTGIVTIS